MGLLEDAIKEHLELKKAHGADEGEVNREAPQPLLAPDPVVEVPEPAEPPAPPTPAPDPVAEVPQPAEPPVQPEPTPEPVAEVPEPAEPPAAPEPTPEPVAEVPEPAEPPAPPSPAPQPVASDPSETVEFDWRRETIAADQEAAQHENLLGENQTVAPAPQETSDLLEATPDFFQETPEYDRLWFEEKSPKDFNFDG